MKILLYLRRILCIEGKQDSRENEDSEEETIICGSKRKRSRILHLMDSDDSDDSHGKNENKNSTTNPTPDVDMERKIASSCESPVAKKKTKIDAYAADLAKINFGEKLNHNQRETHETRELAEAKHAENESGGIDAPTSYLHSKLDFIDPKNIRDKNKHRPTDIDYDPSTLYVPPGYLEKLTPAMRQWWQLKSEHFDSVLFFKVGKFYELYHMDADVGVRELGFTYMRGDFAHSGFPEQSFNRMANSLINRGYKVARCEQTETPEIMSERIKHQHKPTKFVKVVKREICQVVNRGTQVFGQQVEITPEYQPNYMMAVIERVGQN